MGESPQSPENTPLKRRVFDEIPLFVDIGYKQEGILLGKPEMTGHDFSHGLG